VALNVPEAGSLDSHVVSVASLEEFVEAAVALVKRGEAALGPARRLDMARRRTPAALAQRYAALLKQHGARSAADA
jgi:hypothetical protein